MKQGKISDNILKRSVLKGIKTKRNEILSGAGVGEDCAIFALSEAQLATCVREDVLTKDMDMAAAIHKCVNNLASSGAKPVGIMMTLLFPEGAEEPELKKWMKEAEETCASLQIQIAGGHTSVSKNVNKTMVVLTGYGQASKCFPTKGAKPGQDIVISKWIGLEGTAVLARDYKEKLLARYPEFLVDEAIRFRQFLSIIPEAATAVKSGVCVMHDVSEGGIMATLWELADSSGVGLNVDLRKIPIRQETVEVCEFLGANPYELASGGALIMVTDDGENLTSLLEEEGICAIVVGKITDSKDRILTNEEEVRYLDKPKPDELYRFQ